MAVTLHVAADDSAVEDVESREQRGGAVAFVVVRHRPSAARLHRQPRLGAVERLDLALLIDRQNDRMGGRIDVETNNVLELRRELRVGRQLEGANAMRRQSVRFEDALHRTQAHASRFRQHPTGPVGCIARWRAERQIDHPLHDGGGKRLLAGLARLVAGKPVDTLGHESRLPSPDHGFDLPERRMISAVPQPSAVARMMWARHTCFCGALRSATITWSRRRSVRVTDTTMPAHKESLNCFGRFGNRLNESDD